MKLLVRLFIVCASVYFSATVSAKEEEKQKLDCEVGPITKAYGGSSWLVYSCSDNKSMLIISAINNPAMPYFFLVAPKDKGYQVSGQGTGDKTTTKAAFAELKKLSRLEIQELIGQTKVIKKTAE